MTTELGRRMTILTTNSVCQLCGCDVLHCICEAINRDMYNIAEEINSREAIGDWYQKHRIPFRKRRESDKSGRHKCAEPLILHLNYLWIAVWFPNS